MAELLITKDFWLALNRLPKNIFKKGVEFIEKFKADSSSSALHIEPIDEALDPKVRSGRVDKTYRAILIQPNDGNTFLLVYVDHHDKAYQWAKNKHFDANTITGALDMVDVGVVEAVQQRLNARTGMNQPALFGRLSDEDLDMLGIPNRVWQLVRTIRSQDELEGLSDLLGDKAWETLVDLSDDGVSVAQWLANNRKSDAALLPKGAGDFSHLAETSADSFLTEAEWQKWRDEPFANWHVRLHPLQQEAVDWDGPDILKLVGAGGTGKTVVLLHRAARMARGLVGSKEKVLLTTFTNNLAPTLEYWFSKLAADVASRVEVINLHKIAYDILKNKDFKPRLLERKIAAECWDAVFGRLPLGRWSRDTVEYEFDKVVDKKGIFSENDYFGISPNTQAFSGTDKKELWAFFVEYRAEIQNHNLITFEDMLRKAAEVIEAESPARYRHVLVDEVQDFSEAAFRLLAALSPVRQGQSNALCIAGDGHQRIETSQPLSGIAQLGQSIKAIEFQTCYRSSEQIRDWATRQLDGVVIDALQRKTKADDTWAHSTFSGHDVVELQCKDASDFAIKAEQWIADLQKNYGVAEHEICIAMAEKAAIDVLARRGTQLFELKENTPNYDGAHIQPGVRFGNVWRVKGLEFRAVMLVVKQRTSVPMKERYQKYVAATRARDFLTVVTMP